MATPDDVPWLFPGGHPGRPLTDSQIGKRLHRIGVRPKQDRSTALFTLATELPAAIDEFYAKVRAQGRVPNSERKLRAELKKTKERLAELIEENQRQQAEIETFARVVNVLTVENHQLRGQSG
ncbi:hypothetical protein [Streptomyces abyssomicinicus]|uniref:hypothetical protein n=1 Tax=Streptomyces abyssomicinicus TaxID=574929 RepID=UPI001FEC2AFC|nr:hypothetical protein [Streptomyces abyssomicinicus]